jgi:VTC domain
MQIRASYSAEKAVSESDHSRSDPQPYRYERKFMTPLDPREVALILLAHPEVFRESYDPRRINNVYLDTPANRDYFESVDGLSDRRKTRVRWYGETFGPVENPALEIKIKKAYQCQKEIHPLTPFSIESGFGNADLDACSTRSNLPGPVRLALRECEIRLLNSYARRYFVSASGEFRVTMDWDLCYWGLRRAQNRFTGRISDPHHTIVELKYPAESDDRADRIANWFPFRLSRCSKYVMGMDEVL